MAALVFLDCSHTLVENLAPLATSTALQGLECGYTNVVDLAPLAELTALQSLGCSFTKVTDVAPLAGLKSLRMLNCFVTQVVDLAPLSALTELAIRSNPMHVWLTAPVSVSLSPYDAECRPCVEVMSAFVPCAGVMHLHVSPFARVWIAKSTGYDYPIIFSIVIVTAYECTGS